MSPEINVLMDSSESNAFPVVGSIAAAGLSSLSATNGLLAVNPPRKESDLAAMNPQEFQQQLVRGPAQPEGRWVADVLAPGRRERELWRVFMLGAAMLLVLETTLSNRTFA